MRFSLWTFKIIDSKQANRALSDSQDLHVIENIPIWIILETFMLIKGISDYASGVGGVNEHFVCTRAASLLYWLIGYFMLKRFPQHVTKALLFYHLVLSASMVLWSIELCGLENGPVLAYEMITRSYLLLYLVMMNLLNSNYVFTQYYIPLATTVTAYLTVGPHYGLRSHETFAKTGDIFYFMIIFMVSNFRQFERSVSLFLAQYE